MYSPISSPNIGSEFKVDYKGKLTDADGKPAPTFKKHLYIFAAVDVNSKYIFTKLCTNRVRVIDCLESLRFFVAATGRDLQVIRSDNEFITSSVLQ